MMFLSMMISLLATLSQAKDVSIFMPVVGGLPTKKTVNLPIDKLREEIKESKLDDDFTAALNVLLGKDGSDKDTAFKSDMTENVPFKTVVMDAALDATGVQKPTAESRAHLEEEGGEVGLHMIGSLKVQEEQDKNFKKSWDTTTAHKVMKKVGPLSPHALDKVISGGLMPTEFIQAVDKELNETGYSGLASKRAKKLFAEDPDATKKTAKYYERAIRTTDQKMRIGAARLKAYQSCVKDYQGADEYKVQDDIFKAWAEELDAGTDNGGAAALGLPASEFVQGFTNVLKKAFAKATTESEKHKDKPFMKQVDRSKRLGEALGALEALVEASVPKDAVSPPVSVGGNAGDVGTLSDLGSLAGDKSNVTTEETSQAEEVTR